MYNRNIYSLIHYIEYKNRLSIKIIMDYDIMHIKDRNLALKELGAQTSA